MDRKRLEWLLILILLLLNLFLLGAIWAKQAAAEQERKDVQAAAAALLEERGIALLPGVDLSAHCPAPRVLERDADAELELARSFLGGDAEREDQGGSILSYRSPAGRLVLRGTGDLRLTMDGDNPGGGGMDAAERCFARVGVSLYPFPGGNTAAGAESEAETESVRRFVCGWKGFPVFNAALTFRFADGRLQEVDGTLPFQGEQSGADAEGMDAVTALLRFLELAKREGIICSRLEELSPGYMMNVTLPGECGLTPTWHIVTDTVELYLDAVTGGRNAGTGR